MTSQDATIAQMYFYASFVVLYVIRHSKLTVISLSNFELQSLERLNNGLERSLLFYGNKADYQEFITPL